MARDARLVAETLGPEDRVGTAIAEPDRCSAAVEERLLAQFGEGVGHVGFPFSDPLEPRLRACSRAIVVAGERARNGAPEEVGRRGDIAVRGELVGDRADVLVDTVHGRGENDRGHPAGTIRCRQIAIEFSALARSDLDVFACHAMRSSLMHFGKSIRISAGRPPYNTALRLPIPESFTGRDRFDTANS